MNLLIVGCDKGAWQARGRQLGAAIGARATAKPIAADWAWADVILLVKRAALVWFNEAREARATRIWDPLDFWVQPAWNQRPAGELIRAAREVREGLKLAQVIGITEAMARDLGGVYLPHHSRRELSPAPIRPQLKVVAYEGDPRFLGPWREALEGACTDLGLAFRINPPDVRDADLLVAFRGDHWDGWVCRQWKSGVKYANAMAVGRPVLTQSTAAYHEMRPPGRVVEHPGELVEAIRFFAPWEVRQAALETCQRRAVAYTLDATARRYMSIIGSVAKVAA